MPVRIITDIDELIECEKIASIAFVYPLDIEKLRKDMGKERPVNDYIGYFNDEGKITAFMQLPKFQINYEGGSVPMVGLGAVSSLPEYRFGGAVREIIKEAFRKMVDSGAVFSSLYPFSHEYYRKFGYELCQSTPEYELPFELLSGFRYTGKAKMVEKGDSLEGLKTVFDKFFTKYNVSVKREDRHWENLMGDSFKDRRYTYLLEDETGPTAYFVMKAADEGDSKAAVLYELAYTSPKALIDVFGFLYRLSAQYKLVRFNLPEDAPLFALIGNPAAVKCNFPRQHMTRVINVKEALRLKKHPAGCDYTLRVNDEFIPENDGVFSVSSVDGVVSVEKISAETADLILDERTLAQLLTGYLSLDEAMYKKDVKVNGKYSALRSVFVKNPVLLTDYF